MRAANRLPYSGSNCNVLLLKNGLFLPSCLLNERTPHESTLSEKLVKEWEGEDSPSLALYISMHYLLHCHVTHAGHSHFIMSKYESGLLFTSAFSLLKGTKGISPYSVMITIASIKINKRKNNMYKRGI